VLWIFQTLGVGNARVADVAGRNGGR
jgi:hypothetical protein